MCSTKYLFRSGIQLSGKLLIFTDGCRETFTTFGIFSGAPTRAKRAWDGAPYSWNMVNLFLFGCHVTELTHASTDCTGRVGETIKRKGGVSQACLGKSTFFILDIHNMVN